MQGPERILTVVNSLDRGGAETMIMNLYRRFDKTKVQYDFALNKSEPCDYEPEALSMGARIYRLPRFTGANYFSCKKAWNEFWENHPEYRIVHGHLASSAFIYLASAKKHGIYTIVHSHTAQFRSGIAGIISAVYNFPTRFIADQFFGCSTEAGRLRYGNRIVASTKYLNFNNAIDKNFFRFDPETRSRYRKDLNIEGRTVLIHVGRFHEAKNHMFLLDIMSELKKQSGKYVLLLVGEGSLRPQIEKKIADLGLQTDVLLLGLRNDIPALLNSGDIFLFPSLYEGLPCSVIEAVASGLPCLISDTISPEVCICDRVVQLPITHGPEVWVNGIIHLKTGDRCEMSEVIASSGYSIDDTARWLTEFYLGKANRK